MPSQVLSSVENNFTKGLITESTGLNFPENAATDTLNCTYTLKGDVTRRLGIDLEDNHTNLTQVYNGAITTYKWNNAGGDGQTQLVVVQVNGTLYFYNSSVATVVSPISNQLITSPVSPSTINLNDYTAVGASFDVNAECTFADGNGYLFVFNPNCDPIYVTYNSSSQTVSANSINIQIRDFAGVPEPGISVNTRPTTLSIEHQYNLNNQGWTSGSPWWTQSFDTKPPLSINTTVAFQVNAGLIGVSNGQQVYFQGSSNVYGKRMAGWATVVSYSGSTLTLNIFSTNSPNFNTPLNYWTFSPPNNGYISSWFTALGNYPSNADVWWYFKNASGTFDPATTNSQVNLSSGNAPRGHFLLNAFNLDRTNASGLQGITKQTTTARPSIGAWFQGRVWYSGVYGSQQVSGDAAYYTWSENIYFSQVNLSSSTEFGYCYQVNDPTSEKLFDLLPTDGGVIQIPGSGKIYKLFPIQNGMLVFAANGIWFITGSQGIGFAANDYTINKIASVTSMSPYSFVDVLGLPVFWNQEGIYQVVSNQSGQLQVEPLTVGTILSFYGDIPASSKLYARGAYDPIEYRVQWIYRTTEETGPSDRYTFDGMLNYNTFNKAFYPYLVDTTVGKICSTIFIQSPSGLVGGIPPTIKYLAFYGTKMSFADEHDPSYKDWSDESPVDYESYFVTGYKIHGQGQRKFQVPYVYMFNRKDENTPEIAYKIQGFWDYAITGSSGKWSTAEFVDHMDSRFGVIFKRHKIRGRGLVLQFKLSSVSGKPFNVIGWSVYEVQNTSV